MRIDHDVEYHTIDAAVPAIPAPASLPRPNHQAKVKAIQSRGADVVDNAPRVETLAATAPLTIHSEDLFPDLKYHKFDFDPPSASTPKLECGRLLCAVFEISWYASEVNLAKIQLSVQN